MSIYVPFLYEITSRMWNWHNAKLCVRILQLHVVICYVILRNTFRTIIVKFTEKNWKCELRCVDVVARRRRLYVGLMCDCDGV